MGDLTIYLDPLARDSASKRKRAEQRYSRICPVPGCRSKPQKKLSQHIDYKHPQLSHRKRELLKKAKRLVSPVKTKTIPVKEPKQPTLLQLLPDSCRATPPMEECNQSDQGEEEMVTEPSDCEGGIGLEEEEGGTRNYPRFENDHPTLVHFQRHLTGVDGGARCAKTALEMAVDVSKFLRYASGPSAPSPIWQRLTERDQLLGYLDKLGRSSVGPEGKLSKLDALCCALRFMKVEVLFGEESEGLHLRASHMLELIAGWKSTLRKQKRKLRKKRLQELSCQDLKLEEINELLENTALWQEFDNTCTRTKQGETLAKERLNQCSVTLAASILYKNWQRPGAIANATLEEFSACKLMQQKDGKAPSVYVMCVKEHKTAQDGYARVLLEGIDYSRILLYKNTVRKCLDPDGTSTNLFVLSGSRPLTKLSSRIQSLGKIYGLTLPTATRVRKIGATSVALNLGDTATAHLVTRQLSHSAATESQYYQAIVGDRHAVEAFGSMENLRAGGTGNVKEEKLASESPCKELQKKNTFSADETAYIQEHFTENVEERRTPSLARCKTFLELSGLQRSAKNIQDKVKNLIKYQ